MPVEVNPVLAARPTINPYRFAVAQAIQRLKWDVRYASWVSRSRMRAWKERYKDEKCVILCNGPSLLKVDFDRLSKSGVFTFGLNKINLLFAKTEFRPSCIVAVNPLVIEQNAAFYNSASTPLFINSKLLGTVKLRQNVTFFHQSPMRKFARDCSFSIAGGSTVTFVAMQIAFHLGFRRVALVGCDHTFAAKGPPNMAVVSGDRDESHFDPNYFAGGVKWQLPDLAGSEYSYSLAGRVFDAFGGEIVNCTEGGRLEIFKRSSLSEFLESNSKQE